MDNNYCIIMAGGIGSRFWPLSRKERPKQFIDILGTGKTFIQQTFDRFSKLIPNENFLVVTSVNYKDMVLEQLPELNEKQVLLEPLRRNTAPCLAYAAYKIKTQNPNANLIVAPADHLILKEEEFIAQIKNGLEFVKSNNALLTLGIKPSRPETGYGYIQVKKKVDFNSLDNLYKVKIFTEKPDLEMAKVFIDSGEFFWNSGIFIWSLSSILEAMDLHLKDVSSLFERGAKLYNTEDEVHFINKTYSECKGISIDYGIMEKAQNVFVLTADIGWSDLGTWGSLYENKEKDEEGNVISGDNILTYDTQNCIVDISDQKVAVLQGLDGYIIAESNDTLMICKKEDEQQIKQFVTDVRIKKGDSLV
ncbi:MAG: mannose-1-phosphate guanylyltransferase [Prolixibacteraceae bacterium]|jgi:mannose-1-phosphate guanylyltransferase|nr:mannose-1-phosphate guanylyltransferase [Prolixibacteraceae bacterium]MBT6004170.1 mannose-1-phosphate guanylyltransferase [Prolixibacteraceae bacterium]MBT6764970.1 mannose-1-phosphate guanylyltransferase [Prolixibacteraceae bacterium]MBT6997083.1 mannose-1-phosphate guanylyltransferase [Prolixibacteraceae bacterium]MBT7393384.1 mannose-1-phosphate guanylyltransferase [Prolixibacteraceae bacterium]